MSRPFPTAFAAVLAGASALLAFASPPAEAQPRRINALVMTDNAAPEAMSRAVPVYRRVLAQLQEVLNTRGIQIYDETASVMGFMPPGQARLSDAQALAIARAVQRQRPVDVVVLFEIVASVARDPFVPAISYPSIRMPARVLDLRADTLVAAFEVNMPQLPPLPLNCDATCLFDAVGNDARLLASELGTALVDKLAHFTGGGLGAAGPASPQAALPLAGDATPSKSADATVGSPAPGGQPRCEALPGDITIRLRDFTNEELLDIQRNLQMFSCFIAIQPIRAGSTFADYAYRTSAGTARLDRNLRVMLDYLNLRAQVRFDGREFEIVKITTR